MSKTDPHTLVMDLVSQFIKTKGNPWFRSLISAGYRHEPTSFRPSTKVEFAADKYTVETELLCKAIADTFDLVYGFRPEVVVYTPNTQPPEKHWFFDDPVATSPSNPTSSS